MLRFAVDEDFDNRIVRGLLRLLPALDIVRAQDAGLIGKLDPAVLQWAAVPVLRQDSRRARRRAQVLLAPGR